MEGSHAPLVAAHPLPIDQAVRHLGQTKLLRCATESCHPFKAHYHMEPAREDGYPGSPVTIVVVVVAVDLSLMALRP
jgi:hypothetical protein